MLQISLFGPADGQKYVNFGPAKSCDFFPSLASGGPKCGEFSLPWPAEGQNLLILTVVSPADSQNCVNSGVVSPRTGKKL